MAKKKKSVKRDRETPVFEECLAELETIVGELEDGKLGLADALARYEQGVAHLSSCHQLLQRVERKIELLSGIDAEGNPITQPFEQQEHESLADKAAARGRRRSSDTRPGQRQAAEADIDDDQRLF